MNCELRDAECWERCEIDASHHEAKRVIVCEMDELRRIFACEQEDFRKEKADWMCSWEDYKRKELLIITTQRSEWLI